MPDRKALIICAAFTVIGVVLLFDADSRLVGLMSILIFGVGGLALAAPVLTRGAAAPRAAELGSERGVLFPVGRTKQLLAFVACLGFVAGCALIIATGAVVIGLLGVVTFGTFALLALSGLFRARGLVLTPTRVAVLGLGRAEVPWDEIAGVGVFAQGPNRFFGIEAVDPSRIARGPLSRLNRRFVPADLVLPADDPEALVRTVVTYLDEPERRAELGA